MGNLCGRASKDKPDDAFAQPGRTLGSAPTPSSNPRAPVPKIASTSGGRTLGSSSGQGEGDLDARYAAAKAAEVFYLPPFPSPSLPPLSFPGSHCVQPSSTSHDIPISSKEPLAPRNNTLHQHPPLLHPPSLSPTRGDRRGHEL